MKFTLEIELGNDEMRTKSQLVSKLIDVAHQIKDSQPNGAIRSIDGSRIMDNNGNSVGRWALDPDKTAASRTPIGDTVFCDECGKVEDRCSCYHEEDEEQPDTDSLEDRGLSLGSYGL